MFSIITPTYNRSEKLKRAIDSVLAQDFGDWEMIIVNDSPSDETYTEIEKNLNDDRIKYLLNEKNYGVNFSRNRALENSSHEWIIFLDDDDYLANDSLSKIKAVIEGEPERKWVVTNRVMDNGRPITIFPRDDTEYDYAWDYLISKKLKGDATHAIKKSLIAKARFSKHIKNGEEWLFFFMIGLKSKIYYRDLDTTLSDGYGESGLNLRRRNIFRELKILFIFIIEGIERKIALKPLFILYWFMRLGRLIIK